MRRLLRAAALPQPICNARLHGQRPDFLWPEQRLVVQVDGYQFHGHRSAFERDRRNDQVLIAAGYRVVRVTWMQLQHEPLRVAAAIAAALTAGRAPG
jgi:very-short-patch-repair endonuclease